MGYRTDYPRKKKKDDIVGGETAAIETALSTTASKESTPVSKKPRKASTALETVTPYTIQEKFHQDIFDMYEAGTSPQNISRKYPLYSPKEVLELCASQYDLSNINEDQLDAVLLTGFLRDMQRIDKYIRSHLDDPEQFLDAAKVLLDARERTVKYRQLLSPKLTSSQDTSLDDSEPVTWTIEQKITTIIKQKSPEEAEKLISRMEKATEIELQEILEAEFKVQEQNLLPERTEAPQFTTSRQLQHEEDMKQVIE